MRVISIINKIALIHGMNCTKKSLLLPYLQFARKIHHGRRSGFLKVLGGWQIAKYNSFIGKPFRTCELPDVARRGLMLANESWRESICISVDTDDEFLSTPQNVEEMLFEMFKDEKENKVHAGTFMAALMETGLKKSDPRLQEMNKNLLEVHSQLENSQTVSTSSLKLDLNTFKRAADRSASVSEASSPTTRSPARSPRRSSQSPSGSSNCTLKVPVLSLMLRKEEFSQVIRDNIVLISRALRHKFVIPEWGDFCDQIEEFYDYCKEFTDGKVACYIPQLARFDPNYFGVAVCTSDGQRMAVGDYNIPFTMQSCSKPITYAIALNELGSETVHTYVGQEPSGRMFNAIVLDYNNKPHNPLVNAGSILTNGLLYSLVKPKMSSSEKFDYIQDYFKRMAGNENVGFSNGTFLSEREHADRNYALAYYMRESKCFPAGCELMSALDLYFQCCSMEVTAENVSVMAATLANGGICPITGEKVLEPNAVRDVLSLMHSCGMYDYSGQFAFKVGLPAKSGVCGAIMLVIPNVMGVCSWSPPLDSLGNSVRGIKFCERMVEVFNFHRYDNLRHAANKKDPRRQRYESKGRKVVSLLFSAAAGDVTALRRFALSGMEMEVCDYDGRTALHLAAIEGHLEAVTFLLHKCKINPVPKDRWKRTPADDARMAGFTHIEKILNEAEEVYEKNNDKKEPSIIEDDETDSEVFKKQAEE